MLRRWRFFLAQIIWFIAIIGAWIAFDDWTNPLAVLGTATAFFVINGFIMRWGEPQDKSYSQKNENDHTVIRAVITGFMWLIFVGAIIGGAFAELGGILIPLAIIMMIPLLALNSFMWKPDENRHKQFRSEAYSQSEKRKNDKFDSMLSNLSEEDIHQLKQRLRLAIESADFDADDDRYMLSDDGEIVMMNKKTGR